MIEQTAPTFHLHNPLLVAIKQCLEEIFIDNHYADRVIERIFKMNRRFGSRDRALVASAVYDIVRSWRTLCRVNEVDHENCNQKYFESIIKSYFYLYRKQNAEWKGSPSVDFANLEQKFHVFSLMRIYRESIPDWLDKRGITELEDRWDAEIHAQNTQAPLVIRVNTLKATLEDVERELQKQGIETTLSAFSRTGLIIKKRTNLFGLDAFRKGHFELQDEASQAVGEFCNVESGMRVIDACAGAGGKTLQLAALMHNTGKIIALDVDAKKLDELKKRAKRAGVSNVETRLITSKKTIKRLAGSCDFLLIDAPCSGTGVLRRNPDAKWKLKPEFVERMIETQKEILQEYSLMIRNGGRLVYVTCSIFPSENEYQIKQFLKQNTSFKPSREKTFSTARDGTDGFYMAELLKGELLT